MIYILAGFLTWGLGTASVVYSGRRDHADLNFPNFSGGSSAGGAVHPVERPATLGPAALRGAPQTTQLLETENR